MFPINSELKYVPFRSLVNANFFYKLASLKLDFDKIDEIEREIYGSYINLHSDFENTFELDYNSFNTQNQSLINASENYTLNNIKKLSDKSCSLTLLTTKGVILNVNTPKKFESTTIQNIFIEKANLLKQSIINKTSLDDPKLLTQFFLLTYANIKAYTFQYWFAFLANSDVKAILLEQPKTILDELTAEQINSLFDTHQNLNENTAGIFGFGKKSDDKYECFSFKEFISRRSAGMDDYLCILDASNKSLQYPGWPLRNVLATIVYNCKDRLNAACKIVCLRLGDDNFKSSPVFTVCLKNSEKFEDSWIGWERNGTKFMPKFSNLSSTMDPISLADTNADLNLKLMKWRINPDLDLDIIKLQKCLLIGSGTLGCAISRNLIAWGVRDITFLDNSIVSYSNPVRQCLFTFNDSKSSVLKSEAAAAALKMILPTVKSKGINLDILMPGHNSLYDENKVNQLETLINEHDVIFLLTDSRESRWLPTLLASASNKLAITVALGYDTYLIIRHGVHDEINSDKLSCYFCNDVTAPSDSTTNRTLDQKCTVTRPGMSYIASALAVELYISLLQHPDKFFASAESVGLLGKTPHSIRGFQFNHENIYPTIPSSNYCTACSKKVIDEYRKNKDKFFNSVFDGRVLNSYLENLTGLTKLKEDSEKVEIVLLSENDEESDD